MGEKAQKLLGHIALMNPKAGSALNILVQVPPDDPRSTVAASAKKCIRDMDVNKGWHRLIEPRFLAWSWAEDLEELKYLLFDYLESEIGAIRFTGSGDFRITPKGWAYLDSLRQGNPASQIGFIAMWFDKSMNDALIALDKGIRSAGYEPLRIDRKEHNNKIDDEIIAAIRRSKFLVADLTGHRGGVYFEAGFAIGLRLPVIWSCRNDHLEETHFDTRQYNFIVWEPEKLGDLTVALQNRIEATIGAGPLLEKNVT